MYTPGTQNHWSTEADSGRWLHHDSASYLPTFLDDKLSTITLISMVYCIPAQQPLLDHAHPRHRYVQYYQYTRFHHQASLSLLSDLRFLTAC